MNHSTSIEISPTKHSASSGFTLVELLTVITVIAIIMGMIVGAGQYGRNKALEGKARAAMEQMANALNQWQMDHGSFPQNLSDIAPKLAGSVSTNDPWGRAYLYIPGPDTPPLGPQSFQLYSKGRDGGFDGDDLHFGR